MHLQVLSRDIRCVERANDADERLGPLRRVHHQAGLVGLEHRLLAGDFEQDAGREFPLLLGHDRLDDRSADPRLELVGRTLGDELAVVDDPDAVSEVVDLLEVLGRHEQRRALRLEVADDVPDVDPAARIDAGRRLVEEHHLRAADE